MRFVKGCKSNFVNVSKFKERLRINLPESRRESHGQPGPPQVACHGEARLPSWHATPSTGRK
jgi:hypothetical protein